MPANIIVLKFGSSVLRSRAGFPSAVHEVYRWYRAGHCVVVVVSAVGDATEMLLTSARALAAGDWSVQKAKPDPYAEAELLATGERASAAFMGIALERAGIPARFVDPQEIQLAANGSPLDSEPISVNTGRLHFLFQHTPVLVVPGFFGIGADARTHLLGRGGSDMTAVFLAHALDAQRCRLIKDVDGVYERDPANGLAGASAHDNSPRRFASLTYALAIERAATLVQPKAVRFLERCHRTAEVATLARSYASVIGTATSEFCSSAARAPLRVALMGLGTVGFGVYQRLTALKSDFDVVATLVRDREKYESRGVPKQLLFDDAASFGAHVEKEPVDVVVDALCALQPSNRLVSSFLNVGISVVTANKVLVASAGPPLALLATRREVSPGTRPCEFLYSAAVGASMPMIKAIRRATDSDGGSIRAISAVLNGTCNFVLNRAADGLNFSEALHEARELGLTEADPSEDLSGRDAARKLRILIRHAFGRDVDTALIDLEPIGVTTFARARQARIAGKMLRLVATAEVSSNHETKPVRDHVSAHVRLQALDLDHPLANLPGEWNRLLIEFTDGTMTTVSGRGAGRWPTTEAVVADLFEILRGE